MHCPTAADVSSTVATPRTDSSSPANDRDAESSPTADERTATGPAASSAAALAMNASRNDSGHACGGGVPAASAKPAGTRAPAACRRARPYAFPPKTASASMGTSRRSRMSFKG